MLTSSPDTRWPAWKAHLLGLGEKIVRIAVQGHLADALNRNDVFWPDPRRIKDIELHLAHVLFGKEL